MYDIKIISIVNKEATRPLFILGGLIMSEELRTLIEQCEKVNAMVLNFNLYNEIPTALIELENGTPTTVYYNAIDKKWF